MIQIIIFVKDIKLTLAMFVAFTLTCYLLCCIVRSIHTNVATDCLKDVHANVRGSKVLSKLVH